MRQWLSCATCSPATAAREFVRSPMASTRPRRCPRRAPARAHGAGALADAIGAKRPLTVSIGGQQRAAGRHFAEALLNAADLAPVPAKAEGRTASRFAAHAGGGYARRAAARAKRSTARIATETRHGTFSTVPTAGMHCIGAWRADPPEPRGGIVVVQEIYGVNAHPQRWKAPRRATYRPAPFDHAESGAEPGSRRGRHQRGRAPAAEVASNAPWPAGQRRRPSPGRASAWWLAAGRHGRLARTRLGPAGGGLLRRAQSALSSANARAPAAHPFRPARPPSRPRPWRTRRAARTPRSTFCAAGTPSTANVGSRPLPRRQRRTFRQQQVAGSLGLRPPPSAACRQPSATRPLVPGRDAWRRTRIAVGESAPVARADDDARFPG